MLGIRAPVDDRVEVFAVDFTGSDHLIRILQDFVNLADNDVDFFKEIFQFVQIGTTHYELIFLKIPELIREQSVRVVGKSRFGEIEIDVVSVRRTAGLDSDHVPHHQIDFVEEPVNVGFHLQVSHFQDVPDVHFHGDVPEEFAPVRFPQEFPVEGKILEVV